MACGEGELLVDLECGGATAWEEEGSRTAKKTLNRARSESDSDSSDDVSNPSNVGCGRVELVVEKCSETRDVVALVEKKNPGETRKKTNAKKSSKPPRPPKGPVLSASDLKLVKELAELAARKRARIQRMKASRKMKETKRSASSSSLPAMLMTALFFLVIIFQGAFSGNTARKELLESPAPATTNEGLISFQLHDNAPANEMNRPSSLSYNSLEQSYSSSPREEGRDAR